MKECTETISAFEEKEQVLLKENQSQKDQILSLQAEVEQVKQLMDLLQERRETQMLDSPNLLSPRLTKNPSQVSENERPIFLRKGTSHSSKNNSPALRGENTIQQQDISGKSELNQKQQGRKKVDFTNIGTISENIQSPKIKDRKKTVFFVQLPKLSTQRSRASTITVSLKSPGVKERGNMPQYDYPIHENVNPIIKTHEEPNDKNNQNQNPPIIQDRKLSIENEIPVENKIQTSLESKSCNTDFMRYYDFGEEIFNYLDKIDFSQEKIKNEFIQILENYIIHEKEKLETLEKSIQTEMENFYVPTIESVLSTNHNLFVEDSINSTKKLEIQDFISNTLPITKKTNHSIDFNEILNMSKVSTKLDISHAESQKNIANKSKNFIDNNNNNNLHDKFSKISKKLTPPPLQQSSQIVLPLMSSTESSKKENSYLPQQNYSSNSSTIKNSRIPNEMRDAGIFSSTDLPMGYVPEEKFIKWKNEKEVIQEEEEQPFITKEVFEHLKKEKKNEDSNFSKNKHLFNYPFKKIDDFVGNLNDKLEINLLGDNNQLSFENFKALFERLLQAHKKCGKNCKHLKKFYKAIGFVRSSDKKQLMGISRTVISRLPKIC